MKKYLSVLILVTALTILAVPFAVFAGGGSLTAVPTPSGINVPAIMAQIFTLVWQLFVGIAIIMFIVAGILFVTSNGEPGKITSARQSVIWGVVGIIVATIAFTIVNVVSSWVI